MPCYIRPAASLDSGWYF